MSLFGMFREPRLMLPAYREAVARLGVCTIMSPVCVGARDGIAACHSNEDFHGKGKGLKSHDCFIAAGCPPCHDYLDRARHEDRFELMRKAKDRTLYLMFRDGKLKVKP